MTAKHTPEQLADWIDKRLRETTHLGESSALVANDLVANLPQPYNAAPDLLAACKWTARGEHHRACSHRKNPNTCDCYVGACKSAISAGESGE